MRPVQMNQVIAQMRALQMEASRDAVEPGAEKGSQVNFAELLERSVDTVNDLQTRAESLSEAFERGDPKANLVEVMVAVQKAGLAFQAMTQVRNHLVRAYQDVMNMPI